MKKYDLIIFDLDGTLVPSKSQMEPDMAKLLEKLLEKKDVVVISGGSWAQFEKQFLASLNLSLEKMSRLFIAPTSGASFYRFENGEWRAVYTESLSESEKNKIKKAFEYALPKGGYRYPEHSYGEVIEDRGTQISFSALGQQAPLELKSKWDPDKSKRKKIITYLLEKLTDFEVHIGGTTTIDITHKGIDKAYGIRRISRELNISIDKMLFVGDALFEGGNDEAVKKTGIRCRKVNNPEETKIVIGLIQ